MKKIFLNIIIISYLILGANSLLLSQGNTLDSKGRINNLGVIKVKAGQVNLSQDTILGRVELLQDGASSQQAVPNMVFNQLVLKNEAKKIVRDDKKDNNNNVRPLIVLDSLIIDNKGNLSTNWLGWNPENIESRGTVKNNSIYSGSKYLIMNNQVQQQNLEGNGSFSNLMISNPYGVNITKGGFKIEEKLHLDKGEFRNSQVNNFVMKDSTRIIRNVEGSIAYQPEFEGVVDVQYVGAGNIIAGEEIPSNRNVLKSLYVENQGNLTLSKNTVVNDSLIIKANIITRNDTLELNSRNNPLYDFNQPNIEIIGNFKRNVIVPGDSLILNNPWTWIRFNSIADLGQVKAITSTIIPSQFQPYLEGSEKVKRILNISTYSANNTPVISGFNAQFGYGWRHNPGNPIDESNGLNPIDLILQRWNGINWDDKSSNIPKVDFAKGWAYSYTDNFDISGYFAIGNSNISNLVFRAYTLLEGPYIPNSKNLMAVELWKRNILKDVDVSSYPLNLIDNINNIIPKFIPDSVVDFAVLEFRKERFSEAYYKKLVYIRYDGRIVDLNGSEVIRLTNSNQVEFQSGEYFVVLRHRNHAPIISQNPINVKKENNTLVYYFNDPNFIEGGTTALKLVDLVEDKRIYAMKGGFIPYSNADLDALMNVTMYYTNPNFWEQSWKEFTRIGYINVDFNLSGIVNTKDFNISWNNRGK